MQIYDKVDWVHLTELELAHKESNAFSHDEDELLSTRLQFIVHDENEFWKAVYNDIKKVLGDQRLVKFLSRILVDIAERPGDQNWLNCFTISFLCLVPEDPEDKR